MSRFVFAALAGALTLTLANPAHAHGTMHGSFGARYAVHPINSSLRLRTSQSYLAHSGTKFSHGYFFRRNNFYWNSCRWSSRYGCNCYWNPYVSCWYYWCGPQNCYYPLSYFNSVPPAPDALAGPGGSLPPAGPPVP